MPQIQLPTGRVGDTAQRDLLRALVRASDSGPARPTKTVAPPAPLAPMGLMTMGLLAAPDGDPAVTSDAAEVLQLPGGWSLTTDTTGALIAQHEDGSRQVLATRNVPAGEDDNHG